MSIASRMAGPVLSLLIWSGLYRIIAKIFKVTAILGHGSNICLEEGFLPVPVHFHSAVPDIRDMDDRKIWDAVSNLPGIDFRQEAQVTLMANLGEEFGQECLWPLTSDNPEAYYLRNPSFSYGCAASTHCMIRRFKPATVIEIGSGMSTKVIAAALERNRVDDGFVSNYRVIDPYPSSDTRQLVAGDLVERRVELVDPIVFQCLQKNDILFIDSSHSVKIGSDVNYLFLEILPRLAPGVIVHIHDISLPYEYPRAYATSETFRQFWTEQYLLQAFLCFNPDFEVLLAMQYLMTEHREHFCRTFPHYDFERHSAISGSFWMKRKISDER